jgi:hypothetical protein
MKKIVIIISLGLALLVGACRTDYLDLEPQDKITEVSYFNTPDQFKAATTEMYKKLLSWSGQDQMGNIFAFNDYGSDLCSNQTEGSEGGQGGYGRGNVTVPAIDNYWNNIYDYIHTANLILKKGEAYTGEQSEIKQYVAEAKFFRAWHYFFLLKRYGGVPIVTGTLTIESPELYAPRNSRYEVVSQILKDLSEAIPDLPVEEAIPAAEKGRISKYGAEAFGARVALYEATWEKYVGNTTDGDGVSEGAGSAKPEGYPSIEQMFQDAVTKANDVMTSGSYELWNHNADLNNRSNFWLFTIDGTGSNPLGLDKNSNREFVVQSIYDFTIRKSNVQITRNYWKLGFTRKMLDLFLCTDGLPVDKSPLFQGYQNVDDEFANRDYRMIAYILGAEGTIPEPGSITLNGGTSYGNLKFTSWNFTVTPYRPDNTESPNYPQIRLAEVYLIYAEALMELNGSISDQNLNMSLNLVRERAGVAPLTNALAAGHSLDILHEIRRERALELYAENNRFDDLKRWGIAEQELNQDVCGHVVGGASYPTEFKDETGTPTELYNPSVYLSGEKSVQTGVGMLNALVISPAENRNFQRKTYLYPVPTSQVNLNRSLVQNPGYN